MKRGLIMLFILVFLVIGNAGAQSVNSLLLKVSVNSGESVTRTITLSADADQEFFLEIVNVLGVTIDENKFTLKGGEGKNVVIRFNSSNLSEGTHVGRMRITSKDVSYVPIIFEVESKDVFYDLNLELPPKYSEVSAGDKTTVQIKIFDLTFGSSNYSGSNTVDLEYYVYGSDGSVLSSETESIVVNRQTQISKSISLPKNAKSGTYVLVAEARYKSSVGVSSALFSIIEEKKTNGMKYNRDNFFSIALIILFFVGFIVIFIYFIRDRDKFIAELRSYNALEMQRQREFLLAQEKLLLEKGVSAYKIKNEAKQKVDILKQKQEKRVEELKRLKEKGNIEEMERKLEEWKRQGYNTGSLNYKMKDLSTKEMRELINDWKKKYKTK